VLLLAGGSAAVWHVIDPARALWVAVSVLIVTCPCALSLATPATLVAAAGGLAQRGVLLRRLDALEAFVDVRQVFIDKTGTLTGTRPRVQAVVLADAEGTAALTRDAVLQYGAGLARWSTHPLSVALRDVGDAGDAALAAIEFTQVEEVAGAGLSARAADGTRWKLGSAAFVGAVDAVDDAGSAWLARDGLPVASFLFADDVHPDAAAAVAALRDDGLALTLLSGDRVERAQALGATIGIDDVVAQATPEQKLATVRAAQAQGRRVAMVGDGINDAPVLAAADVSMAMGHGALAAQHSADAVIVSGRPMGIVDLHRTALRTMAIVRQNLVWAVVYNLSCIPLAMLGWLPPWAAGLGMAASSVLVVLNAQRASLQ
jgi:P-type Cu2+ transporter